ncbi:hypothetical protein BpHYR1_047687 [Brachionus plicatilis]|uniref:Uncharacterized protein n=1 Tax=Brachionus plicatilis TaxID=10195 RepID=A0A3M7T366_BRAPC|nr:hypothetical protein BpHYR1_047687 [Brachionus plicatilis]
MKKVDTLMRYLMVIATGGRKIIKIRRAKFAPIQSAMRVSLNNCLSSFADNLEEEEAIMGFIDKNNNLEEVNLIENEVQPSEIYKFFDMKPDLANLKK